jgi:hypothetical protein
MKIDVIVPVVARQWHRHLLARLRDAGHDIAAAPATSSISAGADGALLALERRILRRPASLMAAATITTTNSRSDSELTIDLTGAGAGMAIAYDGSFDEDAVLAAVAAGDLPDLDVVLDGKLFDHAAPMIDNRVFVTTAAEDVFARAITLLLKAVTRFAAGERATIPFLSSPAPGRIAERYIGRTIPRVLREVLRRSRYRFAHWRVGYRLVDGPGVAETGGLRIGWHVLPDDGAHFYADPFPFEHDGARYIFVEDYPHTTGKAVIAVSTLDADGIAGPAVPILEEPHHLSYPQVFAHDGAIWMLPEASSGGSLVLYRAEHFPDRWIPVATLVDGPISDATLLIRDDGFWLFATDRDGNLGSTSDTLVVFHAAALTGPWRPHRANPILIDRRRARPGGAFIQDGSRTLLPIQDGTLGYGGGLGLSELIRLDHDAVELSDPRPVSGAGDFPYPQVHTLNRAGRLEVIDGIAAVRKR